MSAKSKIFFRAGMEIRLYDLTELQRNNTWLYSIFSQSMENVDDHIDVADYYDPSNGYQSGRNTLSDGAGSFVVTGINTLDKMTIELFDCTSLLVVGEDAHNGRPISFLSHQDPEYIFDSAQNRARFTEGLSKRLLEMNKRCNGNISGFLSGGKYLSRQKFKTKYTESINLISHLFRTYIQKELLVVCGPKSIGGIMVGDAVYFENRSKILHFARKDLHNTDCYYPKQFETEKNKWLSDGGDHED